MVCHPERSEAKRNGVEGGRGTSWNGRCKEAPRDPSTPLRCARDDGGLSRSVTLLLLSLPALLTGLLIAFYGVDVPYGDQWDGTCHLFQKMEAGTLGIPDFYELHNEHRIFFPRLIAFGLAKLTHWNVRAELLVIWLLACVCSLNIWRLAEVTGWRKSRGRTWLLFAANLLLFTPLQWENLLWGFQIGFFLPIACATACLWIARSARHPFDFLGSLILCLVCTFSVASGFSAWILTLPLLLAGDGKSRDRKGWWLLWLATAVASVCLYFRGYEKPSYHPSPLEALKHPWDAMRFWLAYLGNPFGSGTALADTAIAQAAGAVLIAALAGCSVYLWKNRRDRALVSNSLPWFMLAGIALFNGALTMIGRMGFGTPAALMSRYISFAVMLPVALLFLIATVFIHWRGRSGSRSRAAFPVIGLTALGTAFALLLFLGTINGMQSWERFQHYRLTGKALVSLINIVDEPESLARHVHSILPPLRARVNTLARLGYLRPGLVRSTGFARSPTHPQAGRSRRANWKNPAAWDRKDLRSLAGRFCRKRGVPPMPCCWRTKTRMERRSSSRFRKWNFRGPTSPAASKRWLISGPVG